MKSRASLHAVEPSTEPPVECALRVLLRDRERAMREIADIDRQMLAYRKSYAAERGEFMLPSLERLTRELIG
jgi:hypothetical protein